VTEGRHRHPLEIHVGATGLHGS